MWIQAIARRLVLHPRNVTKDRVERFYVVDLLRGLAAIAVLIWHYQHFFYLQPKPQIAPETRVFQPLYEVLWPAYENGHYAVQLFWLLSGFVFCAVYTLQQSTTRDFVVNRVARLYPLHALSLIVVAALQVISLDRLGHYQIYPYNDGYHFVLQTFFASNWGLQRGESFNGPIWSVSVEVAVYVAFWLTHRSLYSLGVIGPAMVTVIAYFMSSHYPATLPMHFWECGFYFFAGATVFLIFLHLREHGWLMMVGAVVTFAVGLRLAHAYSSVSQFAVPSVTLSFLLAACGLESMAAGPFARRLSWIGDSTYGCYLWHVPVQITVLLMLDSLHVSRAVALHPAFLLTFIVAVIVLATLSYRVFENPARRIVRQWFDTTRPREALAAP